MKEIREFMSKEQLEIVGRLREVKDPEALHMLGFAMPVSIS